MEIIWRENEHTNFSSRRGHTPTAIVEHITAGTKESADDWFRSEANQDSSAHFVVGKDGSIRQYVDIEEMAWGNGLTLDEIADAKASIVHKEKVNPNLYTVSIEHECRSGGALTSQQFASSVWLHQYITDYVRKKWGYEIPIDRDHIIGHCEIDPKNKPFCPGEDFPFRMLIESLQLQEREEQKAVTYLAQKGIINSPEYWRERMGEPMPVWTAMLIAARVMQRIGKPSV